jgi:hypothetical protein
VLGFLLSSRAGGSECRLCQGRALSSAARAIRERLRHRQSRAGRVWQLLTNVEVMPEIQIDHRLTQVGALPTRDPREQ